MLQGDLLVTSETAVDTWQFVGDWRQQLIHGNLLVTGDSTCYKVVCW